jgi:hypothetical protein
MQPILASHFLTGSILTLALPVVALIAVGIYWAVLLRRRSADPPNGKAR